jgi:hypothetical protein
MWPEYEQPSNIEKAEKSLKALDKFSEDFVKSPGITEKLSQTLTEKLASVKLLVEGFVLVNTVKIPWKKDY